nr:GTPase activating protein homolog 4-like isoform X2 [Lytechinus pictus]
MADQEQEEVSQQQEEKEEQKEEEKKEEKEEQTEEEKKEEKKKEKNKEGGSDKGLSPRNKRNKAFIAAEFNRLRESLDVEKTRITKPECKEYSPFIWTSLEPYHNTYTVNYLLDYPEHVQHGYITRKTAIGIVDPEVSHNMDVSLDEVPKSSPRSPREEYDVPKIQRGEKAKAAKGSTRLPQWPVVKYNRPSMANERQLNWGDVPKLREDLHTKYSSNAQDRMKYDSKRTKHDWYRMDLAELKDINEVSRSHMKITCHAYLGTSAGSKKAIASLAKVLE